MTKALEYEGGFLCLECPIVDHSLLRECFQGLRCHVQGSQCCHFSSGLHVTRCHTSVLLSAQEHACSLASLSGEEKAKVAKLIRQVVDLEQELHERRAQAQASQLLFIYGGLPAGS